MRLFYLFYSYLFENTKFKKYAYILYKLVLELKKNLSSYI